MKGREPVGGGWIHATAQILTLIISYSKSKFD